jgi:hypothetical protein
MGTQSTMRSSRRTLHEFSPHIPQTPSKAHRRTKSSMRTYVAVSLLKLNASTNQFYFCLMSMHMGDDEKMFYCLYFSSKCSAPPVCEGEGTSVTSTVMQQYIA